MNSYISSPSKTAALLEKYNIRLKKAYGQNFLIDTNVLKKITTYAHINESDHILEVGSGIGSLTEVMLARGPEIICVEIDQRIIKIFREIFDSQIDRKVTLIEKDAMKLNYADISNKFAINKFVSNLPYKIAAPLILKVFCQAPSVSEAYLTIQKDIADRITASSGDKNYSSYSVKANYIADFEICFYISRNCFLPRPNVDSAFIKAKRKVFGFAHRRKKLINSLQKDPDYQDKVDVVADLLESMGQDHSIRAEELSLDQYLVLFRRLTSHI